HWLISAGGEGSRRTMTWHDFTISFATPAFLGVDPQNQPAHDQAEPRTVPFPISSLRGTLRYWLRALVGAHVGNALAELHRVETEVFGAAAGRGQPSKIILRARTRMPVEPADPTDAKEEPPAWLVRRIAYSRSFDSSTSDDFDRQHLRYLLGQGLYDPRLKKLARRHTPASDQEIILAVRNQGRVEHANLFLAALWALRTFGGMGARVHRGFGTVVMRNPPDLNTDFDMSLLQRDSLDDLPQILTAVHRSLTQMGVPTAHSPELARYPHFDPATSDCPHHRFMDRPLNSDARDFADALANTGKILREKRTFGGLRTYEYDEIVSPYLKDGNPGEEPFCIGAYGLPVGFSDKAAGRSAVVEPVRRGEPVRRTSPLWLRVRNDGDTWSLRLLAFYSEWLPTDITLKIRDTTNNNPMHKPRENQPVTKPDQGEVEGYLDDWFQE
ncbi:MAG: type III-B CRISPR module RAMP protein Cmr1, partial [Pseudonocardiaceae bacterium]